MEKTRLSLLRGVCQMPAYVACERGYFREHGIDVQPTVEVSAWLVPELMLDREVEFAVIPWTRVVAASVLDEPLVLVCGSGCEEAAIVVRHGLAPEQVRTVAVPQRGGMKDLTAAAVMQKLGWEDVETIRLPSGDGAILSLVGRGADAASMVEPYASMLERLRIGTVVQRTGDLWPGAPGCSLVTTTEVIEQRRDLVQRMTTAFVLGARFVESHPEQAAAIASRYIGVAPEFVRGALLHNRPNVHALNNEAVMNDVIDFMLKAGYVAGRPTRSYKDLSFLETAMTGLVAA
jgi:ABC-type nitrate/sulfonate/bicarbonate transport system substrate-binding protein